MNLVHGGDVEGFRRKYHGEPLDFSANISPLGLPQGVRQAVVDSLAFADQYPDPLNRNLIEAISNKEQVDEKYIICGNGAADIIFRLVYALKPRKALIPAPTFAEYEQALACVGCEVKHAYLLEEQQFRIGEEILEQIDDSVEMLFLCQPNNPTGQTCERFLLEQILKRCKQTGTFLVLDECFVDFLDNPEDYTMSSYLPEYDNFLILKAFTKLYAMAGLRLGYGYTSNGHVYEKLQFSAQPWSVSSVAQSAGIAALGEEDYVNTLRALICTERAWLLKHLKELGIRVVGSQANFIFFKSSIKQLGEKLCEKGILIRSCANYVGLTNEFYRIAVRTHAENECLITALQNITRTEDEKNG